MDKYLVIKSSGLNKGGIAYTRVTKILFYLVNKILPSLYSLG